MGRGRQGDGGDVPSKGRPLRWQTPSEVAAAARGEGSSVTSRPDSRPAARVEKFMSRQLTGRVTASHVQL